jgi:hypothetical protein
MAPFRRVALLPALVLICISGALGTTRASRAASPATPTVTPAATATVVTATPTAITPVAEDPCPHITSMALSVFAGGSLHAASPDHLHQLLHVAVEWKLNDPIASTLQPSTLILRRGHRVLYRGWLNVLYPHAVADVVLDRPGDRGRDTIAATLGTSPCSSSASRAVRVVSGSPPRKPWVFPDCLSTYTSAGAACWLIAGGFRPHEALSVSYRLQPGNGARAVTGGLRGRADGHGVFGSIALDLGSEVNWQTAVLRVDVKARRRGSVRTVVHLAR